MIAFIEKHSTYVMVLVGVIVAIPLLWKKRNKIRCNSILGITGLCFLYAFIGVLGVLIFGTMENLIYGKGWTFGATSSYGLYLVRPLFIFMIFRRSKYLTGYFDLYAFYVLPSLFLQRIRCIYAGCCYGKPFFNTSLRWPTREAEMVFFLVMIYVLMKEDRKIGKGGLLPFLMISYGVFRFIGECFRGDNGPGLFHLPHLWSVLALMIGLSFYSEFKKSRV